MNLQIFPTMDWGVFLQERADVNSHYSQTTPRDAASEVDLPAVCAVGVTGNLEVLKLFG